VSADGRVLENAFVKATITSDGSLTIKEKATGKELTDLLVFENVGDIGNEYIFKQPEGDRAIYSTAFLIKLRSSKIRHFLVSLSDTDVTNSGICG
jgi:alpha-mannosidase